MSVRNALLGLLSTGARHGYDLRQLYDDVVSPDKPLAAGQVYSTLGRLEQRELVELAEVTEGDGPDRKVYGITPKGQADVEGWLSTPERPRWGVQPTLFLKVVLTILTGRSVDDLLDLQRSEHLAEMRQLTAARRTAGAARGLLADYALFHLEADLRWLETTAARVADLRRDLPAAPAPRPGGTPDA